jgi:DNA-binding HxlR family transcriptional regulator
MRTYGQYCPIARGAEIFAERWTPLIIRNLHLGCGNFSEILEGAPGLSRTLLSQRLKQLERVGVVESAFKPDGRGHHYELTPAGHDLFKVCQSLGEWGARWLEIAPENLDPFVALWSMCNALRRERLPQRRVVTSPAACAASAIGYSSSLETLRSARRTPASTRTSTSRRKPKPSSNGTLVSSPGPKPPARIASNSTATCRS